MLTRPLLCQRSKKVPLSLSTPPPPPPPNAFSKFVHSGERCHCWKTPFQCERKAKWRKKCCVFRFIRISVDGAFGAIKCQEVLEASSVWVFIAQLGEHCSANAEATGSNPVEAPKILFFGLFSQLLKLRFTAMVTYSFHLYSRSSHHFIQCFIPFTG